MTRKSMLVWIVGIGFAASVGVACQSSSKRKAPPVAPKVENPAPVKATPAKAPAPKSPSKKSAGAKDSSGLEWVNDFGIIAGDYACDDKRMVEARPADADPSSVIWEVYDAARLARLGGDDAALFERFAKMFARKHKREWIREQYWSRLKKHIDKYTRSSADTAFVVCRTKTTGPEEKYFVKSFDGLKSNPPITVSREDGVFRIFFFTY
jgi:hypothetical protein